MQILRKWVSQRKRRSHEDIKQKEKVTRSGSFRVLEENREEIKLLKVFRTNLKKEKSKRTLVEQNGIEIQEKEENEVQSPTSADALRFK